MEFCEELGVDFERSWERILSSDEILRGTGGWDFERNWEGILRGAGRKSWEKLVVDFERSWDGLLREAGREF